MRNVLLIAILALGFTFGAVAQNGNENGNGNGPSLIIQAKQAAQQAGCLSDWNGQVTGQVTVVSACFYTGFITEVLVVPVCNGPGCETVRLAALAKVTFGCDGNVISVECL